MSLSLPCQWSPFHRLSLHISVPFQDSEPSFPSRISEIRATWRGRLPLEMHRRVANPRKSVLLSAGEEVPPASQTSAKRIGLETNHFLGFNRSPDQTNLVFWNEHGGSGEFLSSVVAFSQLFGLDQWEWGDVLVGAVEIFWYRELQTIWLRQRTFGLGWNVVFYTHRMIDGSLACFIFNKS